MCLRDKEKLVDQTIVMLEQFYPHLPFKRARYAIDPVQRVRLLRYQLAEMDDMQFHSELLTAYVDLRDAHTFYGLPTPYKDAFAFLPFLMEAYYMKGGQRRFVVSKVMDGLEHPHFGAGSEVTYWNGVDVERAVQRNAAGMPGGNRAARFARGLAMMTVKALSFSLPPDGYLAFVQYKPKSGAGEERALALPWNVGSGAGKLSFFRGAPPAYADPWMRRRRCASSFGGGTRFLRRSGPRG